VRLISQLLGSSDTGFSQLLGSSDTGFSSVISTLTYLKSSAAAGYDNRAIIIAILMRAHCSLLISHSVFPDLDSQTPSHCFIIPSTCPGQF